MSIASESPSNNESEGPTASLQNRRVWLAPICLCLVAGLHLYRVCTAGQTPWKGGSFGMFSTIDSEHSRFVHAWLMTDTGPRPLQIPSNLEKKFAELRATPNHALAQALAVRLAKQNWIDPQARQQQVAEQLRSEPANVPLTGARLREIRHKTTPQNNPSLATNLLVSVSESKNLAIPAQNVRVEVWKYEMPAGTTQLRARLLFVEQADSEPRP